MKKMLFAGLTILALLIPGFSFTQTVQRDVLANAGGTAMVPGILTVCWTLGETFVATRTSPGVILTEGFHQPEDGLNSPTVELPDAGGNITVSPNPTYGLLDITLSTLPVTPIHAMLYDLSGRNLREVTLTDLSTSLDLQGLPAAVYILSLTDGKQWVRSMQVVKQ